MGEVLVPPYGGHVLAAYTAAFGKGGNWERREGRQASDTHVSPSGHFGYAGLSVQTAACKGVPLHCQHRDGPKLPEFSWLPQTRPLLIFPQPGDQFCPPAFYRLSPHCGITLYYL